MYSLILSTIYLAKNNIYIRDFRLDVKNFF